MNSILAMILVILNNSITKDINYAIAEYIASHYHEIKNMSIRDLASACYTSTSSINKFINCLGFGSYSSFKRMVISSCNIRINQAKDRFNQLSEERLLEEIVHFNPTINIDAIDKQFDRIIQLIENSPRIVIVAAAYPIALSLNFQEDMIIMNKLVTVHQQINFKDCEFDTIQPNDLVLIISIYGSFFNLLSPIQAQQITNIQNKIVITQEGTILDKYHFTEKVIIPPTSDNELYNITLFLFYTLIKTKYYKYIQGHIEIKY